MRRLLVYLFRESPLLLAVATATAVGQSALLIPIALLVRHVFDSAIPQHRTGAIVISGVALVLLYGLSASLGYISRRAALRLTARISTQLRLDVLAKLYALPQGWHDRQRAGEVHAVAVQDTERVEWMLADFASLVLPAILVGLALVGAAIAVSPHLFLVAIAAILPLMLGAGLLARRRHREAGRWSRAARRFSADTQVLVRALPLTKAAGGEASELGTATQRTLDVTDAYRSFESARAANVAVDASVAAVAGAVVLIVGGIAVANGSTTVGSLLSFYAVLALLIRQAHAAASQSNTVLMGMQSLPRIEALLATPEREPYDRGGRTIDLRGEIALEGVWFSFHEAPVLRDVALTIGVSERVALIGPNGAGKSTLVSLVLGLHRPQRGVLRADGIPYDELDIRSVRRQVGVLLQDPVLLPGTIRDNIAYGHPDASEGEIRAAAEAATAAGFIEALPDGYATTVGDEAVGMSGGQRQRIALARALLGEPAVLILDEPTTYLDEAAVGEVMARLAALPQAPTLLLVTHDPLVAVHAERVVELREGRVVRDSPTGPNGYSPVASVSSAASSSIVTTRPSDWIRSSRPR